MTLISLHAATTGLGAAPEICLMNGSGKVHPGELMFTHYQWSIRKQNIKTLRPIADTPYSQAPPALSITTARMLVPRVSTPQSFQEEPVDIVARSIVINLTSVILPCTFDPLPVQYGRAPPSFRVLVWVATPVGSPDLLTQTVPSTLDWTFEVMSGDILLT